MENCEDIVRIKQESNDSWPDPVDSYKAKYVETFTFDKSSENHTNEVMSLKKELDEKIFIDLECKYVKPELKHSSTTVCKYENQSCLPILKVENENQTKTHINTVHGLIKYFECEVCQKSFSRKHYLNNHIDSVHNKVKPFECKICHKSFGYKSSFNSHMNAGHGHIKPFKCDICQRSFSSKGNLSKHINAIHDRSKPFECDICHKSFGEKQNLKRHINTVHNRSKSFECEICHKSFRVKDNHKKHMKVRNCIKP